MNFFKPKDYSIYSPVKGNVLAMSDVKDEVFSQGMMGPGIAVIPSSEMISAPFDGQVKFVFPTKHAIGLVSDTGVELLIHIGIDTVNLEGKPFEVMVKDRQKIKKGQPLVKVDLAMLRLLEVDPTVVLVLTSAATLNVMPSQPKPVDAGELIISITKA